MEDIQPSKTVVGKDFCMMSLVYWISGIIGVLLFVYLFVALLAPEKFQ
jgi:K+-transporting ATPase KdpF subunit